MLTCLTMVNVGLVLKRQGMPIPGLLEEVEAYRVESRYWGDVWQKEGDQAQDGCMICMSGRRHSTTMQSEELRLTVTDIEQRICLQLLCRVTLLC